MKKPFLFLSILMLFVWGCSNQEDISSNQQDISSNQQDIIGAKWTGDSDFTFITENELRRLYASVIPSQSTVLGKTAFIGSFYDVIRNSDSIVIDRFEVTKIEFDAGNPDALKYCRLWGRRTGSAPDYNCTKYTGSLKNICESKQKGDVTKPERESYLLAYECEPIYSDEAEESFDKDENPRTEVKEIFYNGLLEKRGNYKNGKKEGLWKVYYVRDYSTSNIPNISAEVAFVKEENRKRRVRTLGGEPHLITRVLSANWHLDDHTKIEYATSKNNITRGSRSFYRDASLKDRLQKKGTYKNGKRDGLWEYFYFDQRLDNKEGQLALRGTYKNGKRDGLWEYFSSEGSKSPIIAPLQLRGTYKNGIKEGLWEYFRIKPLPDFCDIPFDFARTPYKYCDLKRMKEGKAPMYDYYGVTNQLELVEAISQLESHFYEKGDTISFLEIRGNYKNGKADGRFIAFMAHPSEQGKVFKIETWKDGVIK